MAAALALPQRLTQTEAAACLEQLQSALRDGGPVWTVDAGALTEFDSAALAVLLALRRHARVVGASLELRQVPPRLRELVALYGVGELLPA